MEHTAGELVTRRARATARVCAFVALVVLALASATRAQIPYLVADLNRGSSIYNVLDLAVGGDTVFFLANRGNISLWKSDGTSEGTERVASIPGLASRLTYMNGTLLFAVGDQFSNVLGNGAVTLWKSDGTAAGTGPLTDSVNGLLRHLPLVRVNESVYFFADSPGGQGHALWKTDGTAAGTVMVKIIHTLSVTDTAFVAAEPVDVSGTLYFSAYQPATGVELWKSDGTTNGTTLVKDILPGPEGSGPLNLTDVQGTLYFTAADGMQLWKSDGTEEGTARVANAEYGGNLTSFNGTLFFTSYDESLYWPWLWRSDGTGPGTQLVGGGASPSFLTVVDQTLFFVAQGEHYAKALWKSDGTPSGTQLVRRFEPRPYPFGDSTHVSRLTDLDGVLVFNACDVNGCGIYRSDGSTDGTVQISDISLDEGGFREFAKFGGKLLFIARNAEGYPEIWETDGTATGTKQSFAFGLPGSASTDIGDLTPVGKMLYFIRNRSSSFRETWQLWRSDGSEAGTERVGDFNPDKLVEFDGTLYFTGASGRTKGLWRSDGTSEGTDLVERDIGGVTVAGHTLFLTRGFDVFATDGMTVTPLGTIGSTRTFCGPGPHGEVCFDEATYPQSFTDANGTVFFAAGNDTPLELWKTDATSAGTVKIVPLNDDRFIFGSAYPGYEIVAAGARVFFTAQESFNVNRELWVSDGTPAGTRQVADIDPGPTSSEPFDLTELNGALLFLTDPLSGDQQLWSTDGTVAGTQRLSDLPTYAYPRELTRAGDLVYFAAFLLETGYELWRSDGTATGTHIVADLNPGPAGSEPSNLTAVDGQVYFTASDPLHGAELWCSDGTESGTTLVADIHAGPANSEPSGLALVDQTLFFTAYTGETGRELWALSLDPSQPTGIRRPTSTPTPTREPIPSATRQPSPTLTPIRTPACAGDCGGDGAVGVDDLVMAVNIVLDKRTIDECRACDIDRDGTIIVNEVVRAVRSALDGCD